MIHFQRLIGDHPLNQIIKGDPVPHPQFIGFISVFKNLLHKNAAPQNPRISLFAFLFRPSQQSGFVSACTSYQTTSLKLRSSPLIDPFFDKFTVSSAGNFLGFTEMEEDVFDGLFS